MQPHEPGPMGAILPFVLVAVVFALRYRSLVRERPLVVGRLWIVPALYLAIVGALFVISPPHGPTWLFVALALLLGAGFGWVRGRTIRIHVDPASGRARATGSPAALILLLALILVRSLARVIVEEGALPVNPQVIVDVLLAFALGVMTVQRVEMALRARRLLAAHRDGPAFDDTGGLPAGPVSAD